MLIRCWGSRGSIPVSGKSYEKYGGETTCVEVQPEAGTHIIIDAGSGMRKLGKLLLEQENHIYHIFMTHTHLDHLMGYLTFKPLFLSTAQIYIYGPDLCGKPMEKVLKNLLAPPYSPITPKDIKSSLHFRTVTEAPIQLGRTEITAIPLSHPGGGAGYKFECNGKKFIFLTDNELAWQHDDSVTYQDYVEFSRHADLLFHDAAYTDDEYKTRKTWGHSTVRDALQYALDAGVKQLGLFHHSPGRSDRELDKIAADCQQKCKEADVSLNCVAVASGSNFKI